MILSTTLRQCFGATASLTLLTIVGCKKDSPPPPPTVNVPIRVVVILGPGESLGSNNNYGCRLSTTQIGQYITSLNNYARNNLAALYQGNLLYPKFTNPNDSEWTTANIVTFEDQCLDEFPFIGGGVCFFDPREYPDSEWDTRVRDQDFGFNSNAVNIYFVGNVLIGGGQVELAITTDEEVNCLRPNILVNDRGGTGSSGPGLFVPQSLTLEHEMCHYLVRSAFNTSPYTAEEHTVSATAINIMRSGLSLPPSEVRPPYLPKAARLELVQRVRTTLNPCP